MESQVLIPKRFASCMPLTVRITHPMDPVAASAYATTGCGDFARIEKIGRYKCLFPNDLCHEHGLARRKIGPGRFKKGVGHLFPKRPPGCFAQEVPDTFSNPGERPASCPPCRTANQAGCLPRFTVGAQSGPARRATSVEFSKSKRVRKYMN